VRGRFAVGNYNDLAVSVAVTPEQPASNHETVLEIGALHVISPGQRKQGIGLDLPCQI